MAGFVKNLYNLFLGPSEDNTPLTTRRLPDTNVDITSTRIRRDFQPNATDRALASELNITARACINFRSNQIRRVQWHIMDNQGEIVDDSPFHNMLRWHHMQHRQDFFQRWITILLTHGNVYMEKLYREDNFLPGGIRILNSTYIEPEITLDVLHFYRYDPPNTSDDAEIPRELILHDILPSALSDHRGKSPMDRAIEAINLDRKNMNLLRSYMDNDGKPAAILTLDVNAPNFSDDELDELIEKWTKQGEGSKGGFGARLLPAPFNITAFALEKPDMIYSYEMASLVCREFAIDPALIGVQDQTDSDNRQRLSQMETKFINALTSAVVPDLRHMQDFINYHILPFLAPMEEYEFKWNYDEIDRMIRYSDTSVDQLRSDYLAGAITLDEYRKARFFPEVGEANGGDEYAIPKGYIRIDKDDRGKLTVTIDPVVLDNMMVEEMENTHALAASSSPDFNQVAMTSNEKPGENRYPVEGDM